MYAVERLAGDAERMRLLGASLQTLRSEFLSSVKIKLTSLCNLRCRMCKYWHNSSEVALSTTRWLEILSELAELGCKKVHFSGGEVFLRRDFIQLVEHASQLGLKVNLTTNGTLITRDRLRRLIRARPNSISFSLDGPKAHIHDAIRGIPGSFERTCRTIRRVLSYGNRYGKTPKVRINFVIMTCNYKKLPDMVRLAARLGATELHPMPVDEKGERKVRLSGRQIEYYNRHLAPRVKALRKHYGFSTHPALVYPFGTSSKAIKNSKKGYYARGFYKRFVCLAPWTHLFIGWDGETYLCCMTNRRMPSLGNVGKVSVRDVFNGEAMIRLRRNFMEGRHLDVCHRCDMFLRENFTLWQALEQLHDR